MSYANLLNNDKILFDRTGNRKYVMEKLEVGELLPLEFPFNQNLKMDADLQITGAIDRINGDLDLRREGDTFISSDASAVVIEKDLKINGDIQGNLRVDGNLTVDGSINYINKLDVSDNTITLNAGFSGVPPSNLESGIVINRGSEPEYQFIFKEQNDTFEIGVSNELQPVATRLQSANMDLSGVVYWDASNNRLITTNGLIINGSYAKLNNLLDASGNNINNVGALNMSSSGDINVNGGDINNLQTLNSKLILSVGGNQRNKLLILNDPSMNFTLVNNTNSQPNNFINGASLTIGRENNGIHFGTDGIANNRRAYIQVGHENGNFASSSGDLFLQPFNTGSGVKIGGGTSTEPTEKLDIEGNITMNDNNINNVGALNMTSSGNIDMNSGDINNINQENYENAHLNKIRLFPSSNYEIGTQIGSIYFRNSTGKFNFYKNGVHSNTENDPGTGGQAQARILDDGSLYLRGGAEINNDLDLSGNEIQNFRMGYLLVNNDISLTNQYTVIDCDNSNNAITVQLPTKTNGKIFKIMIRFEGTGNDVTLTASGGQLFYTNVDPTGTSQLVLDDQHSNNTKTIKSVELVAFRLGWMVLRQDAT